MTNSNTPQTKAYKRAVNGRTRFDISSTNYHTTGFMCNRVVYSRELAPKQHIHINLNQFVRTSPTIQPMFGHFDGRFTAFFVPYAMIWTKFNELIEQTLRDGAKVTAVPQIAEYDIVNAIDNLWTADGVGPDGTSTDCDMAIIDDTQSPHVSHYFKFSTQQRRNLIASIEGLGYVMGRTFYKGNANIGQRFSALPLLCWDKVYYDFWKVQGVDSFNFEPDKINGGNVMTSTDLLAILKRVAETPISYPKSYFANQETPDAGGATNVHATTTANRVTLTMRDERTEGAYETTLDRANTTSAVSPVLVGGGASAGPQGGGTIGVNAPLSDGGSPNLKGTFASTYSSSGSGSSTRISQLALQQLGKMTDYVKRISVAGFNAMKRYLAEYGIELPATSVLKTAEFLGDYTFSINLQEITSTDGASLGAQTGASMKSNSRDVFVVDYTAKEFGYLLIYLNIRPKVEFVRGRPRWVNNHIRALDFYKDDFDGFGYQGVARGEMHISGRTDEMSNPSGAFDQDRAQLVCGVVPVYGEYKTSWSLASGDFARATIRNTMNAYHCARIVDDTYSSGGIYVGDNLRIDTPISSATDYLRVFTGGSNYDPFLCHLDFNGYIDAPMRPLFDLPGEWECDGPVGHMNGDERGHM